MTPLTRHSTWTRLAPLLAIAATACVLIAGCGGEDDSPAAADMPEARTPQALAEQVAELLADAEDRDDCKRLEQIDRRSHADLPCPAPEELREQMDSFEVVDSGLYSSNLVGVVDYTPAKDGGETSMVLQLDRNGRWTVVRLDVNTRTPLANAPGEGGANIKKTILRYEAAVRGRDCEEMIRLTYRPAGTPRETCKDKLAATAELARVLKGDPGQRPSFNGGTRDLGFYSLTAYSPTSTHHTFTVVHTTVAGKDRFFVADTVKDKS